MNYKDIEWHVYEDLIVADYNSIIFAEYYKPSSFKILNNIRMHAAKNRLETAVKHLHSKHWITNSMLKKFK